MSCGISTNLRPGKPRFELVLSWALKGFSREGDVRHTSEETCPSGLVMKHQPIASRDVDLVYPPEARVGSRSASVR
jgi:hypothetical protein